LAVDLIELSRSETARLRTQQDLADLTRVMSMAELTASIAHEMKQPLGAILASAGTCLRWLAHRPTDLDQARTTIERIIRDTKLATEALVGPDVVREAAIPKKVRLDVNATVRKAVALIGTELAVNEVTLQEDLQDLPAIWADRTQIQQAIVNLLINAVEAMAAVTERQRVLQVISRREARRDVLVIIRDTGVGLGMIARERLFEPFFTTKPGALGLGLAICRRIVQAHGGALSVRPNADFGVTFELALPGGEAAVVR
jgi:signal transduction histidine kinase